METNLTRLTLCLLTFAAGCTEVLGIPTEKEVQMSLAAGNDQTGAVGSALGTPFIVTVEDASHAPVAGVQVAFVVTTGGGGLSPANAMTDAQGHAQTVLTVGASGANTVEA